MAKLNKLSKMVASSKKNSIAEDFRSDLEYCIEQENKRDYIPSQSFKPSGISACKRNLYYELSGYKPDEEPPNTTLIGICESGTDRHEAIQNYVMQMKKHSIDCEWLDVGKYIKDNNIKYAEVVSQKGNETKVYSEQYNLRFLCDGLIKYKGEYYILEIKTESTNKFNKHTEPWPEHIMQATCYSLVLGVDKVIFLYESKDTQELKEFCFTNIESVLKKALDKFNYLNDCIKTNNIPPIEKSFNCNGCRFREVCKKNA